nr:MAG TPA: hypothetical protein [Caudoviricetes sp.]
MIRFALIRGLLIRSFSFRNIMGKTLDLFSS